MDILENIKPFKIDNLPKREICPCCYGIGILTDDYGYEGSCLTCNGSGYFTLESNIDNEKINS